MIGVTTAEWQAIRLSIGVSLTAVAMSLLPGVLLGWLLARVSFRGKAIVETCVNLPLVLPPVVTGYVLLITFGRQGWLGRFLEPLGIQVVFDWKGAAVASAIMAFPLLVRAIRIAFVAVDPRLEMAARSLGAGPLDTLFHVTLPLARHGIIAGSVLAFARSMGEFGATIMIAGSIPGETRTIPLYVYNQLESPGGLEASMRIVIIAIVISAAALVAGEWIERRGKRRLVNA